MIHEATTREEYEAAFLAMYNHPIMGEHIIGKLHLSVGALNWRMHDGGSNVYTGKVTNGRATRMRINESMMQWLNTSGIR